MAIATPQIDRIDEWLFSTVDKILTEVMAGTISKLTEAIYLPISLFLTIAVMLYCLAVMRGLIETPFETFLWHLVKISVVSALLYSGGTYADQIVPMVISWPDDLSKALVGATGINGNISTMMEETSKITGGLLENKDVSSLADLASFMTSLLIAFFITVCTAILSVVSSLVLITVKVGLALIVCVGPISISAIMFEQTKGLFDRWVSQVINYTMLGVLFTILFSIVMGWNIELVRASAGWLKGGNVQFLMIFFAYLFVFGASIYIFLQLPTIASGLSGGFGLQFAGPGGIVRRILSGSR